MPYSRQSLAHVGPMRVLLEACADVQVFSRTVSNLCCAFLVSSDKAIICHLLSLCSCYALIPEFESESSPVA